MKKKQSYKDFVYLRANGKEMIIVNSKNHASELD